jgi:hypothetical protein
MLQAKLGTTTICIHEWLALTLISVVLVHSYLLLLVALTLIWVASDVLHLHSLSVILV